MKVIIFEGFWTEESVEKDSANLYIFGDNNIGEGCGGQAIIRNLSNSLGIPTKKLPTMNDNAFYSDEEFEDNKKHIDDSISIIRQEAGKYAAVVFPKDGFGTGLAMLPTVAPKTFEYVESEVQVLQEYLTNTKFVVIQ